MQQQRRSPDRGEDRGDDRGRAALGAQRVGEAHDAEDARDHRGRQQTREDGDERRRGRQVGHDGRPPAEGEGDHADDRGERRRAGAGAQPDRDRGEKGPDQRHRADDHAHLHGQGVAPEPTDEGQDATPRRQDRPRGRDARRGASDRRARLLPRRNDRGIHNDEDDAVFEGRHRRGAGDLAPGDTDHPGTRLHRRTRRAQDVVDASVQRNHQIEAGFAVDQGDAPPLRDLRAHRSPSSALRTAPRAATAPA